MVELNNFTDKGNGTYAAAFGHDDMVMAEVQLTFARETLQYKLLKDEFEDGKGFVNDNTYNPFESSYDILMQQSGYYGKLNESDPYNISNEFNNVSDAYRRLGVM